MGRHPVRLELIHHHRPFRVLRRVSDLVDTMVYPPAGQCTYTTQPLQSTQECLAPFRRFIFHQWALPVDHILASYLVSGRPPGFACSERGLLPPYGHIRRDCCDSWISDRDADRILEPPHNLCRSYGLSWGRPVEYHNPRNLQGALDRIPDLWRVWLFTLYNHGEFQLESTHLASVGLWSCLTSFSSPGSYRAAGFGAQGAGASCLVQCADGNIN